MQTRQSACQRIVNIGIAAFYDEQDRLTAYQNQSKHTLNVYKVLLFIMGTSFTVYGYHHIFPWPTKVLPFPKFTEMESARFPVFPARHVSTSEVDSGLFIVGPESRQTAYTVNDTIKQLTLATKAQSLACAGAAHFGVPLPVIAFKVRHPPAFDAEVTLISKRSTQLLQFGNQDAKSWKYALSDVSSHESEEDRFLFVVNLECVPKEGSATMHMTERVYTCKNSALSSRLEISDVRRAHTVVCTGKFIHPRNPTVMSTFQTIEISRDHSVCAQNHYDIATMNKQLCTNDL